MAQKFDQGWISGHGMVDPIVRKRKTPFLSCPNEVLHIITVEKNVIFGDKNLITLMEDESNLRYL